MRRAYERLRVHHASRSMLMGDPPSVWWTPMLGFRARRRCQMSATRRIFPETFKREAVDRVTSSGLSVEKVATELGLHETVLRRWVKQFSVQARGPARRPITQAPAPSPSDLVSEVARLRRENERLRMERDILKKAALIFGSASR
jgi:transposase